MSFSTMRRSRVIRTGMMGFAGMLALSAVPVGAVHENLEFPAAIHTGTCEAPGDEVLALDNLVRLPEGAPAEGESAGAPGAQVVHGTPDDTEIDLTIDDLFSADHILAVFDAEGENIIACGPIGAYTYEAGDDLVFGLRSQGDSPYSGVAMVDGEDDDDDDDATDIDVYLVNNTPAAMATPEA